MTLPIVERLRTEIGLAEAINADITVSLLEQVTDTIEELVEALAFYANPDIYKAHPHGPAFDRRDLSFRAKNVLAKIGGAS